MSKTKISPPMFYPIKIEYLHWRRVYESFMYEPGDAERMGRQEEKETLHHRIPWFNQKYGLKQGTWPFWIYSLKDFELK